MPIDWGSRDTVFRLLAAAFAVVGKEGFKGTYGEIARLFGEPATYDAIQYQFREVSKMADALRTGQAGTQTGRRSVKAARFVQRAPRPPSNLDPGDLEVIGQVRESSTTDRGPSIQHGGRVNGNFEPIPTTPQRDPVRSSLQPPLSISSSEARSIPRNDECTRSRPLPGKSGGMTESAKTIPEVIVIPDEVDKSPSRGVPSSSSAEEITTSFEAEMTTGPASTSQNNEAKDRLTRSSLGHAEERARFRKLYSSDSQGTRAEQVDIILSQNSQEHAAERARYRNLYFPTQGEDNSETSQNISEAQVAAFGHGHQANRRETPTENGYRQGKLPGVARFFGEDSETGTWSREHDDGSLPADATPNHASSYMDHETRKCLLCDGRRFPGEAFYQHERRSQRHHDNLRNNLKVAKANARLERNTGPDLWEQKSHKPDSVLPSPNQRDSGHGNLATPPSPDRELPSQERSQALSADQPGRSFSPAPHKQEPTPSGPQHSSQTKSQQPIIHDSNREGGSRAVEEQCAINRESGTCDSPLKRKRPVQEPEEGESSAQTGAKRPNADIHNANTGDDVLVHISSAALDKLLKLHPDIFNVEWNDKADPTPSGRRAVGPSPSSDPRESMATQPHRRTAAGLETLQRDAVRARPRHSSDVSRDYYQCPSRCDDPADSDYCDEGDENDAEDDEEEGMVVTEEDL